MKIDNFSNKLISNPLVHTILVLFLILIVLGIIRLFMPKFGLGANIGANFGSLKGNVSLEGFNDYEKFDSESNNNLMTQQDSLTNQEDSSMNQEDSFMNQEDISTNQVKEEFRNSCYTNRECKNGNICAGRNFGTPGRYCSPNHPAFF